MSVKRILTIGLELASTQTEYAHFRSKQSLLDWDIVLFKPEPGEEFYDDSTWYLGKPRLGEHASFQLTESCRHWRREIKQVVEAGKTVIVFATELQQVYVDTGERSYSGTGRNQKTTTHVTEFSNYQSIPADLDPRKSTGNSMKLSARSASILAPYWEEFGKDSTYRVTLAGSDIPDCVVTRIGDKPVGAIYRSESAGTLLVLPDLDFRPKDFIEEDNGEVKWTTAAEQFAARMLTTAVALDHVLRAEAEVTPMPTWAGAEELGLEGEQAIRMQLVEVGRRIARARAEKEELDKQMETAGAYRRLLFEKGKPLERP